MMPSKELVRFARKLNKLGIPWHDLSDGRFFRVVTDEYRKGRFSNGITYDRPWCSAIDGWNTMSCGTGIEAWVAGRNEPEWFETPDDVLKAMGMPQSEP